MPRSTPPLKSLADLQQVQRALAETRAREAAAAAERAAAAKKRQAEQNLFTRAIGATQPLPRRNAVVALAPEPPAPIPVQHQLDEQRVLRALHHHAAAVILAHNHPSGGVEPSRADEMLTQTLKAALALVDVRVLDHIVVARGQTLSMAERGLV